MIAPAKQVRSRQQVPEWHSRFLRMLPAIVAHARLCFRHLGPEARAEAVEAVTCNACAATARLAELGKLDLAYAGPLARFGVSQVRAGRMTGGHLNCKDLLSTHCRRVKGAVVQRLDRLDRETGEWQEILVEDRRCGPFDIVRTKLDFAAWLRSLPSKQRQVAKLLATGEKTGTVARRFELSPGRISQLRQELKAAWEAFIGGRPESEVPA